MSRTLFSRSTTPRQADLQPSSLPGQRFRAFVNAPWTQILVILALSLTVRLPDLAVFVGPDEFTWDGRSANFARAIAGGNLSDTYQDGYPGVTLMWAETVGAWLRYGVGLVDDSADWDRIVGPANTMANLAAKRQVLAVTNAILVVAMVLLTARVFGSGVAWLAGFLLAFDPFLLTESRALRSEGIMAGFNGLAVLALLLYWQKKRLKEAVLVGLLVGLALLSKVSAAALLPVALVAVGGAPFFERTGTGPERRRKAMVNLLGWGVALFLTGWLLWPALWTTPVDVVVKMFDYVFVRVTEGNEGGTSFFLGTPRSHAELGALFYPVVILFRTTPITWLGLLLLALSFWPKRWLSPKNRRLVGLMVFYLGVYLALITASTLKYDRFIIPMLPILNVMAALGFVTAWRHLSRSIPAVRKVGGAMVLLVLAGQMLLALPHHPYYYTYFNPLVGGLKQAARMMPVGVGNEGLDQAVAYLNALPNAGELAVASGNSQKIRPNLKGHPIALDNLSGEWVQGDYVLIYISQLQREKHAEDIIVYLERRKSEFIVSLHGLEYVWLYPGPAAQYYGGGHKLEGRGTLFGYDLDRTELTAGEGLPVSLYWRNEGQRPDDRFFVRLMDLDGYVWTEAIAQPRSGFEEANRTENSIVESEAELALPIGMPPGKYFLKPGFRTESGQIIGYFDLPADAPLITVKVAESPSPAIAVRPPFPKPLPLANDLTLLGYNLSPHVSSPDPATWLTLYWRAPTQVERDYVILLRLLDDQQQEVAYWLGRPVRSGYPTTAWQSGQSVQDPWLLELPPEAEAGHYQLELALFDAETEAEVNRLPLGEIWFNDH